MSYYYSSGGSYSYYSPYQSSNAYSDYASNSPGDYGSNSPYSQGNDSSYQYSPQSGSGGSSGGSGSQGGGSGGGPSGGGQGSQPQQSRAQQTSRLVNPNNLTPVRYVSQNTPAILRQGSSGAIQPAGQGAYGNYTNPQNYTGTNWGPFVLIGGAGLLAYLAMK